MTSSHVPQLHCCLRRYGFKNEIPFWLKLHDARPQTQQTAQRRRVQRGLEYRR
jgi:hypothetical protein